jgi:integrase
MFYAEEYQTRHRESLQTKDEAEARRLIAAKNQVATQPVFNLEMAKVYLKAHDQQFCERTWSLVSDAVQHTYEGSTKARWEKFIRSEPVQGVVEKKLIQTTSSDFLAVLNHPEAGVSTNVFLRILHNRALDLGWIVQPVIAKRGWPKIRYGHRRGITREEHERILAVTKRSDYRDFLELLWETGGSQTDIASLTADDIDWPNRRLYYERAKLESRGQGRACLAIGSRLESILKRLPTKGFLFPNLVTVREAVRAWLSGGRKSFNLPRKGSARSVNGSTPTRSSSLRGSTRLTGKLFDTLRPPKRSDYSSLIGASATLRRPSLRSGRFSPRNAT